MRGGILVVGSLLWDNQGRKKWRQSRLTIDQKVLVWAPIYYGRRSESRCNTYTMTFTGGRGDPKGQAWLVPCKNAIDGVAAVVAEAKALWKAEKPTARPGEISAPWGCVGVLFRPGNHLEDLQQGWGAHFRKAHFRKKVSKPIPPLDKNGVLGIPWPTGVLDGALADMDVILATATKPKSTPPSAKEVADAWLKQNKGHERYFLENVSNGIRTPEDGAIWRRIEERRPDWLGKKAYAASIAVLRGEAVQETGRASPRC